MISIIIPLYNKERFIIETLESILNSRKGCEIEIIIVDDCSTDNSVSLVEEIDNPFVKLIKLSCNSGPSYARNVGIRSAKYDFVYLLDADDIITDELLSSICDIISKNEFDVFVFGIDYCNQDGAPLGVNFKGNGNTENYTLDRFYYHKSLIKGNLSFSASNVCFRKQLCDKIGYFNESFRYSEDAEFWARMSSYSSAFFINKCFVYYRLVDDSLSSTGFYHLNSIPILLQTLYEHNVKYKSKICLKSYSVMYFKYVCLAKSTGSPILRELNSIKYLKECTLHYLLLCSFLSLIPNSLVRFSINFFKMLKYRLNK